MSASFDAPANPVRPASPASDSSASELPPSPPPPTGHICHSDCSEYSDSGATSALIRKRKPKKMEARTEHQLYKQFNSLSRFNTLIGGLLFALVLIWCTNYRGGFAWHSDYNLQFNWHPLLMTLGMIFVFAQSMLIYRSKRFWAKRTLKMTHAGCHIFALICSIIGLKAVFDFHNYSDPPKANLYSLHSWIGLTAVIIFAFQYLLGFVTFLYPGLANEVRRFSLPIHVATGTSCFLFCVIAAFTGLTEKTLWTLKGDYEHLPGEGILINFIGVLLAMFAALSLYLVNNPDYKRVAEGEEQIAITEHTE